MINAINFVFLNGHVGQDPKMGTFGDNKTKCLFSLAVKKIGGNQDKTNWFNIVAFGKTADLIGKYVKKGSSISVLGTLETWISEKDGIKRTNVNVVAESIAFGSNKKEETNNQQTNFELNSSKKEDKTDNFYDDTIPF